MHNPTIFHKYDIRGKYPDDITAEIAYQIGHAFVALLKCKNVVVGRDARLSSPALFHALVHGIRDHGANVTDIGLCTTPMLYFASAHYDYDAAVMITASHLPRAFNGFKLCKRNAIALSYGTGLENIERLTNQPWKVHTQGNLTRQSILRDYHRFFLSGIKKTTLRVVVDCANHMGVYDLKLLKKICTTIPLFTTIDGTFAQHDPNPLVSRDLRRAQHTIRQKHAHLGIAFDGDADRAVFLDERGNIIPPDLITALLALHLARPGDRILFDSRSSRYAQDLLRQRKLKVRLGKVGHSLMVLAMRHYDALLGGEKSGHYYFKKTFYADSALFAALSILHILATTQRPLSELVRAVTRGYQTPELNYLVRDKERALQKIERAFRTNSFTISHFDGLTIIHTDYWFNIRPSNTQPYLRLTIEAHTRARLTTLHKKLRTLLH